MKKNPLESQLQNWSIKRLMKKGFFVIKFAHRYERGWPDLLVMKCAMPLGITFFIELKRPGKVLSAIQTIRKHQLHGLNIMCFEARNYDDIDNIIKEVECRVKTK